MPTNVILGVIFSVAHLVIMEANGDLQESNLKVWFLAYALMQIITLIILAYSEVQSYRARKALAAAADGQASESQQQPGIEMVDKSS